MSGVALVLSIGLSSPLFYFTTLEVKDSIFTNTSYSYCYESWGSEQVWRAMKNDSGRQLKKTAVKFYISLCTVQYIVIVKKKCFNPSQTLLRKNNIFFMK